MSIVRVGIDLRGPAVLVVRVNAGTTPATIMALGKYSNSEHLPLAVRGEAAVAFGIPDFQTQTKIVHLSAIAAEHQMAAARFETTSGLLDPESSFAVTVMPIGQAEQTIDAATWLGLAVRKTLLRSVAARWLEPVPQDLTPDFLSRGVALGRGYLRFCEAEPEGAVAVCDLGSEYTSLCFLKNGSIQGTAILRPLPNTSDRDAGLQEWASELETLIRYRTGTDQAGPAQSSLVFAGERADKMENLQNRFTRPCSIARLRTEYRRSEAGGAGLTTDWLVALGLTVN